MLVATCGPDTCADVECPPGPGGSETVCWDPRGEGAQCVEVSSLAPVDEGHSAAPDGGSGGGSAADAGTGDGSGRDGGSGGTDVAVRNTAGGCGCMSAGHGLDATWLALAALLLFLYRARVRAVRCACSESKER